MQDVFERAYEKLRAWGQRHAIRIQEVPFPKGTAGEFDGLSMSMNQSYPAEDRLYYAIHAVGSVILWSTNKSAVHAMFAELRRSKETKDEDSQRLEKAIKEYRSFESDSSCYAVKLLADFGADDIIESYTNFMQADLEALTQFHRTGKAPVWREFFAQWNADIAAGLRKPPAPFPPRDVPVFQTLQIENQEILQEQPEH